ncbi:hypothetical protein ACFV1W_36145 [Kitasatospora sp. NPDC059648]|uniref:hypothetical protein n=1 Tax=Kitasatospora sp. NPDC059648 TaxID=3346894 RepID=UPI0036A353B9
MFTDALIAVGDNTRAHAGLLSAVRQVGETVDVAATGAFVGGSAGGPAVALLLPAAVCALSAVLVRRSRPVG